MPKYCNDGGEFTWPEDYRLGQSIDRDDDPDSALWNADVFLTDNRTDRDVAVHYLRVDYASEEEAEAAVEAVRNLPDHELRKLTWYRA